MIKLHQLPDFFQYFRVLGFAGVKICPRCKFAGQRLARGASLLGDSGLSTAGPASQDEGRLAVGF